MIVKLRKILIKLFALAILLILVAITIQYSRTKFYNFPKSQAFHGDEFYNPYQTIEKESQSFKANFHAHGKSWNSFTAGSDSDEEIYKAYIEKGYDIAGISNYHSLSQFAKDTAELFIPVYEHGFNILKSHNLVLNPKAVSFFDFPLLQTTSMQQDVIEEIKKNEGLVAIAHPTLSGRSAEDMRNLVHYDFTEVLNHFRVSDNLWDTTLSNGRLSWVLGNDDLHDLKEKFAFKIWNVIYSDDKTKDAVLANMKKGKHYSVKSLHGKCDKKLNFYKIEGNQLHIQFSDTINAIEIIGQNGKIIYTHYQISEFYYDLSPSDTYIRIEAHDNDFSFYLNPIVRFDGKNIPYNTNLKLSVNPLKTWAFRISMWILIVLEMYLAYRVLRRKRV